MHDYTEAEDPPDELPRLLTPDELSDYLGVPIRTLDRWRSQGTGPPFVRFGRAIRYPVPRLLLWVNEQLDDT